MIANSSIFPEWIVFVQHGLSFLLCVGFWWVMFLSRRR